MDANLKKVVVVGASGKMGRGIARVLLEHLPLNSLVLIDISEERLNDLRGYLRQVLKKFAEKKIIRLRKQYQEREDLVSNQEIIETYLQEIFDKIIFTTYLEEVRDATLVFEAIIEDVQAKCALFEKLSGVIFTNTSSIPIHVLEEKTSLQGKILGYHFYNPPASQKLLEIIPSKNTPPSLLEFGQSLANRLEKTAVLSSDVAGFIGNGFFLREVLFAFQLAEEFSIPTIDTITKKLKRPMGIFQLVDFVGIAVCHHILNIMREYLPDPSLYHPWLEALVDRKISSIFSYENGKPIAVLSMTSFTYQPIDQASLDPSLEESLAKKFSAHSEKIQEMLVSTHVAKSLEDVQKVLQLGFHHAI